MQQIIITEKEIGKRIDKFLAKEFFLYSREEIVRRIKKGEILLNEQTVKPSYVLLLGDIISFENFSDEPAKLLANDKIKLEIIFENSNIIVINKPAGIQVHPSAVEKESTIANWAIAYFPKIFLVHDDSVDSAMRPGIVHRLDKNTSGVMLLAKNLKSFAELKKLFSERKISKTYLALVHGNISDDKGIIDAPISRSANHKKQTAGSRKVSGVSREAVTEYTVLKRYKDFTLVEAHPLTGRMHQIRVHFSHIGHPVVGDDKYQNKVFGGKNSAKRQLLHAQKISFKLFSKNYYFQAPLAQDFESFLANID